MDEILTPIRISSLKTSTPEEGIDLKLSSTTLIRPITDLSSTGGNGGILGTPTNANTDRKPTCADDALEILRSQPSLSELSATLGFILSSKLDDKGASQNDINVFDIKSISPLTSRVVNVLIVDIIPSFWGLLKSSSTSSHKSDRSKLLQCLRSIVGLGGVIDRLRLLLKQVPTAATARPKNVTVTKADDSGNLGRKEGILLQIGDLMDVLGYLLKGDGFLGVLWERMKYSAGSGNVEDRKREMAWKEFLGLIAGGKVLSVAAEADIVLSEAGDAIERRRYSWIGDGKEYTSWLRENISKMVDGTDLDDTNTWKAIASVLSRGFGLGYNESLIDTRLYLNPQILTKDIFARVRLLLSHLKQHERGNYINTLLKLLSQHRLPNHIEQDEIYTKQVSLVAKIIEYLCILDDGLQAHGYQDVLLEWILVNGGPGSGEPIGIRRAIICALKASTEAPTMLQEALESQVQTFGENLWIRHAPLIHQEVNVQCLLLCAGYVHSQPLSYLKIVARSSAFMNGVSNHLSSTNTRVRFLGMIVGETISAMIDKEGRKLAFKDSLDASEEEAAKWRVLVKIDDILPNFDIFKDKTLESSPSNHQKKMIKKIPKKPAIVETTGALTGTPRIQELSDDSDDDGLIPYPKPDSDPEDSDDDATLVNRNKVAPPVYIRDLLYLLTDHDSFDKQRIALLHAAVLIRRKASYGTELSSHAVDLLTALSGMQDKFDMENFDTLRLKAMISLLVTLPRISGPWIAQRIFEGDYNLSQRCMMLSAVGVAATELAGEDIAEDSPLYTLQLSPAEKEKTKFPSKRLTGRLHSTYTSTPVDTLSSRLKTSMLQPLAAKAAEDLTPGPSLIKVRKFSTRTTTTSSSDPAKKPKINNLSQVVIPAFFGPLTGRWWVFVKDHGGAGSQRLIPHLLTLYVNTLTVLLHATGPNGVMVPQMVDALWDILLSLRHTKIALENSTVLDAVLMGLLTIFEVCNEDRDRRRLAEEKNKELVETQEWVSKVFEGSDGSEGVGEERRGLAAAVLLRCREVVERYERILMGDLIG